MPKLKTLAVTALIFLLLIEAAQPASAANWVELEKVGDETWSIDRDSVQTKSYRSIVSVWIRVEYPSTIGSNGPNGTISFLSSPYDYRLALFEFDFSDRTYRAVAHHDYSANGNLAGSDTTPSRWRHIVPNSIAENIYSTLKRWLNR